MPNVRYPYYDTSNYFASMHIMDKYMPMLQMQVQALVARCLQYVKCPHRYMSVIEGECSFMIVSMKGQVVPANMATINSPSLRSALVAERLSVGKMYESVKSGHVQHLARDGAVSSRCKSKCRLKVACGSTWMGPVCTITSLAAAHSHVTRMSQQQCQTLEGCNVTCICSHPSQAPANQASSQLQKTVRHAHVDTSHWDGPWQCQCGAFEVSTHVGENMEMATLVETTGSHN